ncbi:MAG: hypothetical protein HY000_41955 [Planctomycetes bacterium]|nr:hypothetical protein [Planctomycetota bacterium]
MKAGDTYIRAGKHIAADPHLWIIISDPAKDKQLVAVNVTSQRTDKDQSCVLYQGEHEFLQKESVIMYSGARVVLESAILSAISSGLLKRKKSISRSVLARVRKGAVGNKNLPLNAKRILQAQGIIPPDDAPTRTR